MMNEEYNELNTVPPAGSEPPRKAPREKRRGFLPGIIAGFLLGVIALAIGLVLWQGYVMIPLGKLGVITIRMPYYNDSAVAEDGSLNTREINRKMEEIQNLVDSAYLYEADPQRVSDGIFTGMLYGLTDQDKYALYYSAEAFAEENKRNSGSYDGIGVTVQTDEETGGILVISVNSQGPAKEAGVQVDDIILEADGTDLVGMPLDEAISEHIKGPVGTSVVLTILRDGEKIELTVGRATIIDITVRGTMIADTGMGYISISSFTRSTEKEFKRVWNELEEMGAEGLVLDLRNNGGGDMDVSLRMLDFILDDHISVSIEEGEQSEKSSDKTLLLSVEGRTGRSTEYYASDRERQKLPAVLVVNGRSASASEIFTGVLMDYGYRSVGEKTFGKGIVQSVYRLSDNSGVKFTTDQYILPGGEKIHGVGIEPTVTEEFREYDEVTASLVNFASGEETDILQDNQILKAVEMLQE